MRHWNIFKNSYLGWGKKAETEDLKQKLKEFLDTTELIKTAVSKGETFYDTALSEKYYSIEEWLIDFEEGQ